MSDAEAASSPPRSVKRNSSKKASSGKPGTAGTGTRDQADDDDELLQQKALDTPRTREGCRRLGLTLEQLRFRPFNEFYIPGDLPQKQQLRYEHYERKRRERLKMALTERAKVIMDDSKRGDKPGAGAGHFLGMMEIILDKESKRLEHDLKAQLRYHSAMERDNQKQLDKEQRLKEEEKRRDVVRKDAKQKVQDEISKHVDKEKQRHAGNQERVDKRNRDHAEQQERYAQGVIDQEVRLVKFKEGQAARSFEKSGKWRDRVEGMKVKTVEMQKERVKKGDEALKVLEDKINAVTKNRDDDQMNRQVRSEEQHLHLLDVRSNKDRIDRIELWRMDHLRDEIDGNMERIETLLALKDQILEQRKARNSKMEATHGARALNLARDCPVGPGRYDVPRDMCLHEQPITRITQSNISHEQFVEEQTKATKGNPAPGAYDVKVLPNGERVDRSTTVVPVFGKGVKSSYLNDAVRAKKEIPAPGRYDAKNMSPGPSTKFRRESIDDKGLDEYSAKQYPVWARPGTETPGPAAYNVDGFMRKEVLRRAQRSLPNLTREMLKAPPPTKLQ